MDRGPYRTVLFRRAGGFYLLDLPLSDDIAEHVRWNPGTIRVEDAATGAVLWPPKPESVA